MKKSGRAGDKRKSHRCLAQSFVLDGVQSPIQDEKITITHDGDVEVHKVKSSDGVNTSGEDVSCLLDQQQCIAQNDSDQKR